MIPRFVVIDELARAKFEKKWHIAFGYGSCFVSDDIEEAIKYLDERIYDYETTFIVEKIDDNGKEMVYKR